MVNTLLDHYIHLTEFLGTTLGPDFEVTLHDLTSDNPSIIAIANGHISGRSVGAPLTNRGLQALHNDNDDNGNTSNQYHYLTFSINGKKLRSSALYIRHEGNLIGILSINFDDSRYQAACSAFLSLCHPDEFIHDNLIPTVLSNTDVSSSATQPSEIYYNSTEETAKAAVNYELNRIGISADRLNTDERMNIIASLESSGIFLLKDAVKDVADMLHCSPSSIYRYLSQIKRA